MARYIAKETGRDVSELPYSVLTSDQLREEFGQATFFTATDGNHLCATTIHKGAYSGLPDAYGAIVAWINANGYHMNGMPYEIYRKTQFDKLPPEEWETEIFFPVKK